MRARGSVTWATIGLVALMVLAGCGSTGDPEDVGAGDDITVGGGVVVQEEQPGATRPPGSEAPTRGDTAPPPPPGEVSPHPTDASGQPIRNTTIRQADGLVLQLTVDQTVGYEGDLVIDLVVTNQRDEAIDYDPAPPEGAYVVDEGGAVVWTNGRCAGVPEVGSYQTLAPEETVRLTFQLERDGGGNQSCALPAGRYGVVGQLFWCPATADCAQLNATASHPVPITLEDG